MSQNAQPVVNAWVGVMMELIIVDSVKDKIVEIVKTIAVFSKAIGETEKVANFGLTNRKGCKTHELSM